MGHLSVCDGGHGRLRRATRDYARRNRELLRELRWCLIAQRTVRALGLR
jgi:hypothetical protein